MPQVVSSSLFEKLGGKKAVETVVDEFYRRVLGDPELKGYFAKTDMAKQKRHQTLFITMALGGPKEYNGRTMKRAHEPLKITSAHFDKVASHLSATLAWAGVSKGDIFDVINLVAPLKADIVSA